MIRKQLLNLHPSRLEECERVIERGLTAFVDVGKALAEIRDAKLYKADYGTFEDYCQTRWGFTRSRASQLISQNHVAEAITSATGVLSNSFDISKRDADALKADLPTAVTEIAMRVKGGESVDAAKVEVVRKRQEAKAALQAGYDRQREDSRAALPEAIRKAEEAKIAHRNGASDPPDADRIAELEEANKVLEAEASVLRARIAGLKDMETEFKLGGFDKVIEGKDHVIAALTSRLERESADKVAYMRASDMWRKRAYELGWSNDEIIQLIPGMQ